MKTTKVRELMTTEVISLDKRQAIPLAQELMRMMRVRHLPVIGDEGELVGMVTHRSLLGAQVEMLSQMASDEEAERELSIPVAKVMTTEVQTVGPDAPVSEALKKMLDARQGVVVVVEERKIVGVLTSQDFLKLMLDHPEPDAPPPVEELAKRAASEAVSQISASLAQTTPPTAPRWLVWMLLILIALLSVALLLPRHHTAPGPENHPSAPAGNAPSAPDHTPQGRLHPAQPPAATTYNKAGTIAASPAAQPAAATPSSAGIRPNNRFRAAAAIADPALANAEAALVAQRDGDGQGPPQPRDGARAYTGQAKAPRPIPPGQQLPLPEDISGRVPRRQKRWIPEPVAPPR